MSTIYDVSVILPTYNRLWCLPHAIESCRNTICSTEIIVVDDGSTDGTWEWLTQQQNIIAIQQSNMGKCWAANKGFEIAKGKYLRFLDSDDVLDIGAIDEQFVIAENDNADIVVSGYKIIDEHAKVLSSHLWVYCDDFIAQQLGECDSSHYSAYLFRKEFLKDVPHRPDFAFRDDRMLVLEAALKKPIVSIHKGHALLHRTHQNNRLQFTSGLKSIVQNYQHLKIYHKILVALQQSNELTPRRSTASIKILWPLAHWIAKQNIKDANEIVKWIYELDPGFIIPEKGILGLLYKKIGFKGTERILKFRRIIKQHE